MTCDPSARTLILFYTGQQCRLESTVPVSRTSLPHISSSHSPRQSQKTADEWVSVLLAGDCLHVATVRLFFKKNIILFCIFYCVCVWWNSEDNVQESVLSFHLQGSRAPGLKLRPLGLHGKCFHKLSHLTSPVVQLMGWTFSNLLVVLPRQLEAPSKNCRAVLSSDSPVTGSSRLAVFPHKLDNSAGICELISLSGIFFYFSYFFTFKILLLEWRDGSMVKSACCSCIRPVFGFWQPHGVPQPFLTPISEKSRLPFWLPWVRNIHMVHIHTYRQNTH